MSALRRIDPVDLGVWATVDRHSTGDERNPTPCAACQDAGWFVADAGYGDPAFGTLVPCACTTARRARQHEAQLYAMSNLAELPAQTFATFNAFAPGMQVAHQRALAFAQHACGWLTLLGPCGCGKTHLAAAIAHAAVAQQIPTLFVVVPDLLDHLRATFSPTSEIAYDQLFEQVRSVELLILDDLGTESATPWAREKLYQLINHRYNHRQATVFTSNVPLEHLDPRVASRMHDPAVPACVLTIQAKDYRRRGEALARKRTATGGG
jgi:DNA replication protein DnaC